VDVIAVKPLAPYLGVRLFSSRMKSRVFNPPFCGYVIAASFCVFPQTILTQKGWVGGHKAALFSIVIVLFKAYTHLKSRAFVKHPAKTFGFMGLIQRTPCDSKSL
jgi:hypothetical protein